MSWIDWLIVLCPLAMVAIIGFKTQKYVKGVSDFLSAGRVAGRYVVAVANGEAAMGLISLVAMFEAYYKSGLAYSFWGAMAGPIGMIMLLTGFCIYRYRETRAMTMGQFLEMRYSRGFRIYAGILQSISGILNYAIFPAVGARFLVYFCDMPILTNIGGVEIPTFMIVMAVFLGVAVFVATMGGQITIMTTDCVQGILSYPLYAIIVIYLLSKFSWFNDIVPPLLHDRPEGESFLNPFDISKLRDFNIFYVCVGIFSSIFNRMAWSGTQGYNSAAKNAHEQKIGGVLGTWRTGFSTMMYVLLAVCAFAYLNGGDFKDEAANCRNQLAVKAMEDITRDGTGEELREDYKNYIATGEMSPEMAKYVALAKKDAADRKADIEAAKAKIEATREKMGLKKDKPKAEEKPKAEKAKKAEDTKPDLELAMKVGKDSVRGFTLAHEDQSLSAQTFGTVFGQMRVPMALKSIMPIGITGVFCALCVFLLISTDTTYLHSWGGILVQDVILPWRGKPFTPRQHLNLLRIMIISVAIFAFLFSAFFAQIDFILMFFAITGMIWLGGAGVCIVGGLYWKRGTAAGAFTALTVGSTIAVTGMILQKTWESNLYPWLDANDMAGTVAVWLETASRPFNPYISWQMSPNKFPINSQEMFFFSMLLSVSLYIIVSLLTCKKPHNMDQMLHRGKYHREGDAVKKEKLTFRVALNKLIGINSQYTKGDRILARAVFIYSFGWGFGSFLTVVIWNNIAPWPKQWWGNWYFITTICVAGTIAIVSTFWFTWGGIRDLIRMFRELDKKEVSVLDDGRVIDGVSADDIERVEKIEHITIPEAHVEEEILREELEEEGDVEDIKNLDEQIHLEDENGEENKDS